MKKFILSSLAVCSALATFSLVGCGGSAPAAADPAAAGTTAPGAAPVDPSKPVGPKAINAGKCPSSDLVDDFEDGDNKSVEADMRGGYWYTYMKEGSTLEPEGSFEPRTGEGGQSKAWGAIKGTVSTAEYPYVGLGISFTDPKQPYDASCCQGVSFKGRKAGGEIAKVRLKVGDWQTSPEGGLCKSCYNDFGADFVFTEEWQEFTLKFADMKQEPYWGEAKAAIDPTALYQLQWQGNQAGLEFDIEIDDVKLVGCGE